MQTHDLYSRKVYKVAFQEHEVILTMTYGKHFEFFVEVDDDPDFSWLYSAIFKLK